MQILLAIGIIAAVLAISLFLARKSKLQPRYLKARSQRKNPNVETYDNPHRSEF